MTTALAAAAERKHMLLGVIDGQVNQPMLVGQTSASVSQALHPVLLLSYHFSLWSNGYNLIKEQKCIAMGGTYPQH
jgi:hypothetical protein